jgi:hypothetical protein
MRDEGKNGEMRGKSGEMVRKNKENWLFLGFLVFFRGDQTFRFIRTRKN